MKSGHLRLVEDDMNYPIPEFFSSWKVRTQTLYYGWTYQSKELGYFKYEYAPQTYSIQYGGLTCHDYLLKLVII